MTSPAVGSVLRTLVTFGITELVGFCIEHLVEGIFYRTSNHLTEMTFYLGFIDFYNIFGSHPKKLLTSQSSGID
jgi:hypothetical protein